MRVYRNVSEVPAGKRVVAIGTFDGVHAGHQRIIGDAVNKAKEQGALSMVITFHPHPLSVIAPSKCPPILTPLNIKTDLIGALDVDELLVIPFTEEFSHLPAEEFCRLLFSSTLGAVEVIVGDNFRFGRKAEGDIEFLKNYAARVGMKVIAEPLVTSGGEPISSTRIRNLLLEGRLAEVRQILGRPPSTHGKVVHGDKRGRTMGVRTANVEALVECIFPGRGVYLADLFIGRRAFASLVNVGHNPTFCSTEADSGHKMKIEAHILDFDLNIYGQDVRVDFLERLRDEMKFEGPEQLIAQIKSDIAAARRYEGYAVRDATKKHRLTF